MIVSLIKSDFLLKLFQEELIFMRWMLSNIGTLELRMPVHLKCLSNLSFSIYFPC